MPLATFSSSLDAQGFHFTLSTIVNVSSRDDHCTFHLLLELDPHVYADQYELAQRPEYTSLVWGDADLERPVSAVHPNGSVLLVTTHKHVTLRAQATNFTVDVPLHARYGRPTETSGAAFHPITLKHPIGFFACIDDSKWVCRPIVVPELLKPYASYPGWPPLPLFLVKDSSPNEQLQLVIPVGVREDLAWVDVGTAITMTVMFFYLLFASIRTARRLAGNKSHAKTE
ncbi:hypothetical protein DICSQDRAFT_57442 [Dichomitus squalens LYAD-421 SS1]|uniref:uncharacterized protein n=1 Tax=Dichomitus squalens (strain LYAD-421) TaxID=732165 RepID=UPI00044136F6|nr:uncharacterized protein DICSQDRAFT_57442 [Dichomitus squalens LYAD-421 SS1]EJF62513.1 hypothetical protein DICSQDRAFT_57442 [Dichomitus squalens LYAD-421 SS1]